MLLANKWSKVSNFSTWIFKLLLLLLWISTEFTKNTVNNLCKVGDLKILHFAESLIHALALTCKICIFKMTVSNLLLLSCFWWLVLFWPKETREKSKPCFVDVFKWPSLWGWHTPGLKHTEWPEPPSLTPSLNATRPSLVGEWGSLLVFVKFIFLFSAWAGVFIYLLARAQAGNARLHSTSPVRVGRTTVASKQRGEPENRSPLFFLSTSRQLLSHPHRSYHHLSIHHPLSEWKQPTSPRPAVDLPADDFKNTPKTSMAPSCLLSDRWVFFLSPCAECSSCWRKGEKKPNAGGHTEKEGAAEK